MPTPWLPTQLPGCEASLSPIDQLLTGLQITSVLILCQIAFDVISTFPSKTNKPRTLSAALECHTSSHQCSVTERNQQREEDNKGKLLWNHGMFSMIRLHHYTVTVFLDQRLCRHLCIKIHWRKQETFRSDHQCMEAERKISSVIHIQLSNLPCAVLTHSWLSGYWELLVNLT